MCATMNAITISLGSSNDIKRFKNSFKPRTAEPEFELVFKLNFLDFCLIFFVVPADSSSFISDFATFGLLILGIFVFFSFLSYAIRVK